MATRKYEQGLRAEAAEQTRRRILDAVDARLRAAPAEPVNLDKIARAARVARPTIYAVFGSRAGLFSALAHDLFTRGGLAILDLIERSGYDTLTRRPRLSKHAKTRLLAVAVLGRILPRPRSGRIAPGAVAKEA